MGWFDRKANVEFGTISGVLRVEIHTSINWPSVVFEIAGIGGLLWALAHAWLKLTLFDRAINAWLVAGGIVGVAKMLRESERIEFGRDNLTIGRTILGWDRTSTYAVDSLSELTWRVQTNSDHFALECKAGLRKFKFGQGVSEDQAQQILAELQRALPDVAQKMGSTGDDRKSHITRLSLS